MNKQLLFRALAVPCWMNEWMNENVFTTTPAWGMGTGCRTYTTVHNTHVPTYIQHVPANLPNRTQHNTHVPLPTHIQHVPANLPNHTQSYLTIYTGQNAWVHISIQYIQVHYIIYTTLSHFFVLSCVWNDSWWVRRIFLVCEGALYYLCWRAAWTLRYLYGSYNILEWICSVLLRRTGIREYNGIHHLGGVLHRVDSLGMTQMSDFDE